MLWRPVRGVVRTVSALPQVVDAILVLPTLAERLERVDGNTDACPTYSASCARCSADTAALPLIHEELVRDAAARSIQVEANTLAVERLAEIAVPLQGAAVRVGRLADRLPQRAAARGPARG